MKVWWYSVEIFIIFVYFSGVLSLINLESEQTLWRYAYLGAYFAVPTVLALFIYKRKAFLARLLFSICMVFDAYYLIRISVAKIFAPTTSIYLFLLGAYFVVGAVRLSTLKRDKIIPTGDDYL